MSDVINREYVSKGVSALPEWWEKVEDAASELQWNRSFLIRVAVEDYLKDERAGTVQTEPALSKTP